MEKMGFLEWYHIVIAFTVVVLSGLVFCTPVLHQRRKKGLPPGPLPLPFIGCLHLAGTEPPRSLSSLALRYGPVMTFRIGTVDAVLVSSAEAAKTFLRTYDLQFASRPKLTLCEHLFLWDHDVGLTAYGENWRRLRMFIVNNFLNPKTIESLADVREQRVSALMRKVWSDSKEGTVKVDLSEAVFHTLYEILWGSISRNTPSVLSKELLHLPHQSIEMMAAGLFYDFFPVFKKFEPILGITKRMKKARIDYDRFAEAVFAEHAASEISSGGRKSFVDLLLDISKEDSFYSRQKIKSIMFDVFVGSVHSAGMTIDWALSHLLKNPECLLKAKKEVDEIMEASDDKIMNESHVLKMKYLLWVVKETLRLHMSTFLPPRLATEDMRIDDYNIPKGMWVIINTWAIARDEKVWEDPDEFKPERFANEEDLDMTGFFDFKSLPFGAGRRGCPGYLLAFQIVYLTIGSLLHNFELSVEGDPSKLDMAGDKYALTRKNHLCVFLKLRNKDFLNQV